MRLLDKVLTLTTLSLCLMAAGCIGHWTRALVGYPGRSISQAVHEPAAVPSPPHSASIVAKMTLTSSRPK
jgi:hypothetical protein